MSERLTVATLHPRIYQCLASEASTVSKVAGRVSADVDSVSIRDLQRRSLDLIQVALNRLREPSGEAADSGADDPSAVGVGGVAVGVG